MDDEHKPLHNAAIQLKEVVDHGPAVDHSQNLGRGALKTGARACRGNDENSLRTAHAGTPSDRLPPPREAPATSSTSQAAATRSPQGIADPRQVSYGERARETAPETARASRGCRPFPQAAPTRGTGSRVYRRAPRAGS